MRTSRLGTHVEILSGFAFKSGCFNTDGRGLPLVRIRDVKPAQLDTYYDGDYDDRFILADGDLLVGMDGEFNCARWKGGQALLNQRVCRIRTASSHLDDQYLFWFLPKVLKDIEDKSNFVTVKHLSGKQIDEIEIPLPPLGEQKRIAAILDQADELRRKRQHAINRLNQLGQAIFYEMFGDPHANDKKWPSLPVGEVTNCIVPGRDKPKSFSGDIPWITTAEIVHLGLTSSSNAKAALSHDEVSEVRARVIPANSVIMTCVGDLGKVSIAQGPMVINQQLHSFQCKPEISPYYLMYILSHRQNWMAQMATQTTLPYMNKTICNTVPILLPPITLQNEFANRLSALNELRKMLEAARGSLQGFFASLQHRAFQGEL